MTRKEEETDGNGKKKKKNNSEKGHLRGNSFPKSLAKP